MRSDTASAPEFSAVCAFLYIITRWGYPPAAADTPRHLRDMHRLGFRRVELEGIRERHLSDIHAMRHEIRHELDTLKLEVPYFCAVLPGLGSADKQEREKNMALFRKGCEVARLLGARGILDNAPLPPYVFADNIPVARHYDASVLGCAKLPDGFEWASYWRSLVRRIRALCDMAAEFGLTYQLHPADGCLASTTDGFLLLRRDVNRDNLRFNFDTANLFAVREQLPLSLLRLGSAVDYIHLSDNRGGRMEHLATGAGAIPWAPFFEALDRLRFDGLIALDIGGDESVVEDLDAAYVQAARWLEDRHG